jgi:hypothetical protein
VRDFGSNRCWILRRHAKLFFNPSLFDRLAIQSRVVDRDRRFRRQRLQRGSRRLRQQRSLFAAVEIQHSNRLGFDLRAWPVDVTDQQKRYTEHLPDAVRDRGKVIVPDVMQVANDRLPSRRKDLLGNLRLVSNRVPESETRPCIRASFISSSPRSLASMTNPRSAPVTSMAASMTSVRTSSSTRLLPNPRSASSSVAI